MNLSPDNIAEEQHKSWLTHPSTIQLIKNLEKFQKAFADSGMTRAEDHETPNEYFRNQLYGYRTVQSVINQIKSTDKFLEQAKK